MVLFEIKKMFSGFGSRVVLVLLAASVILCFQTATYNWETTWVDENGEEQTGFSAVQKLRAARKAWAGPLDQAHLTAVIQENQRILATPEYNSHIIRQRDIAYGWRLGISDIRDVLNDFCAETFNTFNYYRADSLRQETLPDICQSRVRLLKEWLEDETSEAAGRFSQVQSQWLIRQYQALETPMVYDYYEGWQQVTSQAMDLIIYSCLLFGYLCCGIFPNEFKWKADAIYFSSFKGRRSAAWAKILAGFLVVTVLYWAAILVYSLPVLAFLGFDGWNCPIQLDRWKSFYNITMLERYLLSILGGYLGNLFFTALVMWISAKTRAALLPVTAPFLLYMLPNFILQYVDGTAYAKVLGLLPDRLLQLCNALNKFDLYTIGPWVIPAVPLLFVLYSAATALLVPMIHREFTGKEIL